jgi:serine protease Do
MYNDENNLYHYTYRKDGSETDESRSSIDEQLNAYRTAQEIPSGDNAAPVTEEIKPEKKPRKFKPWTKVAALILVCALAGGAAGAGITMAANRSSGSTSINVSGRKATSVAVKTVDGKSSMSDAENYAANVNSVVSINTSGTTTNVFGQSVEEASAGTGFIITKDGYIATNYHVVSDASSVKVTLYNGKSYTAKIVGGDEDYDIAVLKIDASDLKPVTLGDSNDVNVGDHVLAIGNPLGELTFSMSGGMVSCVNRAINVNGTPFNMIQTDASINAGNSGGPLLNAYGEVVGIVSAKYSSGSSSSSSSASIEGLGFAIPINDVAAMIQDIMTNGYVTNKPYLGITAQTMNQQMAQQTNLTEGVYVYSVVSGGAAEKAGIKVGDVIVKVGSKTISSMEDLTAAKKSYSAGDKTVFTVYRDGKKVKVTVTWGKQPKTTTTSKADTSTNATQKQDGNSGSNNNSNNSDQNDDIFNYFFGGNQDSDNSQSGNGQTNGTGTAA